MFIISKLLLLFVGQKGFCDAGAGDIGNFVMHLFIVWIWTVKVPGVGEHTMRDSFLSEY